MIIVVATENKTKIKGIAKAFRCNPQTIAVKSKSGVSEQPLNDEVYEGARNRLYAAKNFVNSKNQDYDYIVSCEGGLIDRLGYWFNIQVVMIEDSKGNQAYGISQGYQVPNKYIDEIADNGLAAVMDKLFDNKGGISYLSSGQVSSRAKLVEDATVMALAGMNWEILSKT